MNIITRSLINDDFVATELQGNTSFDKSKLSHMIDLWKYILKYKCQAQRGESILIGMQSLNMDYLAVCFAAAELSLKLVIVDYSRKEGFTDIDFFDPKTKILAPIDIFLYDFPTEYIKKFPKDFAKFKFFTNCSNRAYSTIDDFDYKINNIDEYNIARSILPTPNDVLMRCTSSGTTGTPKVIEHTHEFLYKVSTRNTLKFSGLSLHTKNLNHGSSLAVYLLPTLINVKHHLFYDVDEDKPFDDFVKIIKEYSNEIEFIMFPYSFMIDEFISASNRVNIKWPKLNLQTLSYISESAKLSIEKGLFKSITSIFGSNETSGPVFISYMDKEHLDCDVKCFSKVDNFYKIKIHDTGLLGITLPVYNKEIITNDIFEKTDNGYLHKGRSDLIRINGETLDIKIINDLNLNNKGSYLITDTVENCIYLAFWSSENLDIKTKYENFFKNNYKRIVIKKTAILEENRFRTGIKIDNELLREYFRNYD